MYQYQESTGLFNSDEAETLSQDTIISHYSDKLRKNHQRINVDLSISSHPRLVIR